MNNLMEQKTIPQGKKYSEIMDSICEIANYQEGLSSVEKCKNAMAFLEGVGLGRMLFANIQRQQEQKEYEKKQKENGLFFQTFEPSKRYVSERFIAGIFCLINYAPGTIATISPDTVLGLHPLVAPEEDDFENQIGQPTEKPQLLN